ncbi:MAG: hypothetical protein PHO00_06500 [bacterium]|nr:hypothetical protein [bacterium]
MAWISRKKPYFINKLLLVFICLFAVTGILTADKNRALSVIAWGLCFICAVCAIIVSLIQIMYISRMYKAEKKIVKEDFKKSLKEIR